MGSTCCGNNTAPTNQQMALIEEVRGGLE